MTLPTPLAPEQVYQGWPEEMEVALRSSSIMEEHRALIGTSLSSFRPAETGMHEVFKGLFKGFEVRLVLPCLPLSLYGM